jgi:hypothetical protein
LLIPDDGNPVTLEEIKAAYKLARKGGHKDVRGIVWEITRYSDDPRFKGLAGDKTLWNTIKQLLEAERAEARAIEAAIDADNAGDQS